jgi:hypothetical protein
MKGEEDAYRVAAVLIRLYGEDAPAQAANRAADLRRAGNLAAYRNFQAIIRAIEKWLESDEPASGARLH